jgi:hypothetical protein
MVLTRTRFAWWPVARTRFAWWPVPLWESFTVGRMVYFRTVGEKVWLQNVTETKDPAYGPQWLAWVSQQTSGSDRGQI